MAKSASSSASDARCAVFSFSTASLGGRIRAARDGGKWNPHRRNLGRELMFAMPMMLLHMPRSTRCEQLLSRYEARNSERSPWSSRRRIKYAPHMPSGSELRNNAGLADSSAPIVRVEQYVTGADKVRGRTVSLPKSMNLTVSVKSISPVSLCCSSRTNRKLTGRTRLRHVRAV